jgi:hypothetical protein
MHLSLKGSLKSRAVLTYVTTDQALDLGNLEPFTIPDLSGNANTATLYTGIYVSTNGTTDKAINASYPNQLGVRLSIWVKPVGTTAGVYFGSTAGGTVLSGLTAGVWQKVIFSGSAADELVLGWDGTTFYAAAWSDAELSNIPSFLGGTSDVVAHWKLYDSAAASLDGYPALDCVGGYHGTYTGCAGGSGEPDILQTAGEDFNINTTTYVGKTVYVAQSEVTQDVDALGNSITNPRPNERVLNLTTGTGYATVADSASLDLTTAATWEIWGDFSDVTTEKYALHMYDFSNGKRSWGFTFGTTYAASRRGMLRLGANTGAAAYAASFDIGTGVKQILATFNSGIIVVYVNGVAATLSVEFGSPPASLFVTDTGIRVGASFGNTSKMDSQIGDIRIYDRALTADEITKNYNARKGAYGL